jgi:sulfur relay (sulfurtransferase) DsrF/TusC family protein
LQRQTPRDAGPEAFDLVLTAAAFDQKVQLILLDDGIFWLSAGLPELLTETVDEIFVERQSLTARGLAGLPLPSGVASIERDQVAGLIHRADVVVGR